MRYQVRFVEDGALPSETEWAFARTKDATFCFVKRSAIDPTTGCCAALTHAWEAWQGAEVEAQLSGLRAFSARHLLELEEPAHAL